MPWSAGQGLGRVHGQGLQRQRCVRRAAHVIVLLLLFSLSQSCRDPIRVRGRAVSACARQDIGAGGGGRQAWICGNVSAAPLQTRRAGACRNLAACMSCYCRCMSCLCMSDMRAVNQSHWGCMSSAAVHVPFFRWQLCVGMLCRKRKTERGCRKKGGRFPNTGRMCSSQGGLFWGPFSGPLFSACARKGNGNAAFARRVSSGRRSPALKKPRRTFQRRDERAIH